MTSTVAKQTLVGWKLATSSLDVASVRYRGLLPVLALADLGVTSRVFSIPSFDNLDGLDCLVFVKSFKPEDLLLAIEAKRRGIPVVMDLCDNIFIENYGLIYTKRIQNSPLQIFNGMVNLASAIVASTQPLAGILRQRIPATCQIYVIPDCVESSDLILRMRKLLDEVNIRERVRWRQQIGDLFTSIKHKFSILHTSELHSLIIPLALYVIRRVVNFVKRRLTLLRLLKRLDRLQCRKKYSVVERTPPLKQSTQRIVWFGHHGAAYAQFGMLDLLRIQADLESIAAEFPVELVVVSNNVQKFESHIRSFSIQTRYVEWSHEALLSELSKAAVVVIPNSLDDFSVCKSPNRAVLALMNGVPVVATRTPALDDLSGCMVLDDFKGGVRAYLVDKAKRETDVQVAQSIVRSLYCLPRIAKKWLEVIDVTRNQAEQLVCERPLLVVIQNALDWQMLRPVVEAAMLRSLGVGAVLNTTLGSEAAQLVKQLRDMDVEILLCGPESARHFVFPSACKAVLCAAESSLPPHRMANTLVKKANAIGIYTATLQHGYETPGLTYHDRFQSARKIDISASQIYLWGGIETLSPAVPLNTVQRCKSVGCPEVYPYSKPRLRSEQACGAPAVAIFENLHWHRYSRSYREFLLEGIHLLAVRFPMVRIQLHTHPYGRWLTRNQIESLHLHPNISFQDNAMTEEGDDVLCTTLSSVDAVITTPSTVAVHAARFGLPIAIVAGGLRLDKYMPLRTINEKEDWVSVATALLDIKQLHEFKQKSQEFINRSIYPGNAASRIIDDIKSHLQE